jgi:hypothetical protein
MPRIFKVVEQTRTEKDIGEYLSRLEIVDGAGNVVVVAQLRPCFTDDQHRTSRTASMVLERAVMNMEDLNDG